MLKMSLGCAQVQYGAALYFFDIAFGMIFATLKAWKEADWV